MSTHMLNCFDQVENLSAAGCSGSDSRNWCNNVRIYLAHIKARKWKRNSEPQAN
jgi:hypothetical protein